MKANTNRPALRPIEGGKPQKPKLLSLSEAKKKARAAESAPPPIIWADVRGDKADPESMANVAVFLRHLGIECKRNEFTGSFELHGCGGPGKVEPWDDKAFDTLRFAAHECGARFSQETFRSGVEATGWKNVYHPVRDYLTGLEWDGKSRVRQLFTTYAKGAKEDDQEEDDQEEGGQNYREYAKAVAVAFMVSAVARIFKPGSPLYAVPVLEGPQGAGKSSMLRALTSEPWFTDSLPLGASPKEVIEETRGVWIAEFSELAGMTNRDVETVKAMITRGTDRARTAYARTAAAVPRQFVFVATTNEDSYLRDSTGNRRFWPIRVEKVDIEALERDRGQLWAEAVYLSQNGAEPNIPEVLWPYSRRITDSRRSMDQIEERLRDLLDDFESGTVLNPSINEALGLSFDTPRGQHNKMIKTTMLALGFKKCRETGGRRNRGWTKSHSAGDSFAERTELSWAVNRFVRKDRKDWSICKDRKDRF